MEEPRPTTSSSDDLSRRRVFTTWYSKWALLLIITGIILFLATIPSVSKYSVLVLDDDDANSNNTSSIRTARKRNPLSWHDSWYDASADDEYSFDGESKSDSANNENDSSLLKQGQGQGQGYASSGKSVAAIAPQEVKHNNNNSNSTIMHNHEKIVASSILSTSTSEPSSSSYNYNYNYNYTTDIDIDLVSLTIREDFFILFNNSALTSWLHYIQNVRSVTFIGPARDYQSFCQNMKVHYPHLKFNDNGSIFNNMNMNTEESNSTSTSRGSTSTTAASVYPSITWVNETHWINTYKNRYRCPYASVCQQLIKLYVFDLKTKLGLNYIGNNILIVDSDTVWSRNATFVHPNSGKAQYWEVFGTISGPVEEGKECSGMDPIKFTEGITAGTSLNGPRKATMSPYKSCVRNEYPNATGARHIVHHMLFQHDVMMHLHSVITQRWNVSTVWEAFNKCRSHNFCESRVAEYELYYAFVTTNYPERVRIDTLANGVDYMGASAVCSEKEMKCCRERGVLLKGCHDHRIRVYETNPLAVGDMCCR